MNPCWEVLSLKGNNIQITTLLYDLWELLLKPLYREQSSEILAKQADIFLKSTIYRNATQELRVTTEI